MYTFYGSFLFFGLVCFWLARSAVTDWLADWTCQLAVHSVQRVCAEEALH
jgi:hypothetical protein